MKRRTVALVCAGAVVVAVGLPLFLSQAREDRPRGRDEDGKAEVPIKGSDKADLAEVRKASAKYLKAFARGDAKGLAATYTAEGEHVGADGNRVKGRKALEQAYKEFFKKNPKARLEARVEKLVLLRRGTALEEGTLTLTLPGSDEPSHTRYSAILVKDGGKWLAAVVRESEIDPAELVSVADLAWLVGKWSARGDGLEMKAHYAWDEDRTFLICTFEMKEKGKVVARGRQRIGRDPATGQLRSWVFESSGGFGEGLWERDGKRWIVEAWGVLPDGSETTAVNLIVPLGPDAFSFQSVERTVDGGEVPDLPPIKVSRVKK